MKKILLLIGLCFSAMLAMSQAREVHGRVMDGAQSGEPMIGATVMVKGTNQGTVTDFDGNFVLSVPKEAVLVISSVGYIPAPLVFKGKNVHLVGDCLNIGNLRTVIWRAYEVAMKI